MHIALPRVLLIQTKRRNFIALVVFNVHKQKLTVKVKFSHTHYTVFLGLGGDPRFPEQELSPNLERWKILHNLVHQRTIQYNREGGSITNYSTALHTRVWPVEIRDDERLAMSFRSEVPFYLYIENELSLPLLDRRWTRLQAVPLEPMELFSRAQCTSTSGSGSNTWVVQWSRINRTHVCTLGCAEI